MLWKIHPFLKINSYTDILDTGTNLERVCAYTNSLLKHLLKTEEVCDSMICVFLFFLPWFLACNSLPKAGPTNKNFSSLRHVLEAEIFPISLAFGWPRRNFLTSLANKVLRPWGSPVPVLHREAEKQLNR